MDRAQIDRFFRVFSAALDEPATVVLTGAAAGSLWGNIRPSRDVDFAVRPRRESAGVWEKIDRAVAEAVKRTGISADYAKEIDRWGTITLLDYWKTARSYRRFGKLTVRLMDPAHWSIGKLGRYLEPDVADLIDVFSRHKVSFTRLARLWGRALRESPPSSDCFQFRRQAEHFLRAHGRKVWGKGFNSDRAVRLFREAAGIRGAA